MAARGSPCRLLWMLMLVAAVSTWVSESRPGVPAMKTTSAAAVSKDTGRVEAHVFNRARALCQDGDDDGWESDGDNDDYWNDYENDDYWNDYENDDDQATDTSDDEETGINGVLWKAAAVGDLQKVKAALVAGADVNAAVVGAVGFLTTPLIQASRGGHVEVVRHLLEVGADPNFASSGGTALSNAVRNQHIEIVKVLVDGGADLEARRSYDGATALLATVVFPGTVEMVETLIDKGADVNATNNKGSTALFLAASKGKADIVALLIAAGTDPDKATSRGATPLIIVAQKGKADVMVQLLEADADPRISNNYDATPLHLAAYRLGREGKEMTSLLLSSDLGVEVDARDKDGRTPLMWASRFGNPPVVKLLLEAGADGTAVDERGRNATKLVCTCVDNEGYDHRLQCLTPGCSLPSTPAAIVGILAP